MSYDFRSDTVTRPTEEMVRKMSSADVGDDVFGDDPTVKTLEDKVADLLQKEAALFVVSGTMSNLLAMRLHLGPLDEVLCDHRAHIQQWEVGNVAAITGASIAPAVPEPNERFLSARSVAAYTRLDHNLYHQTKTRLLALEHTQNGEVCPYDTLVETVGEARKLGLATHLDGARIWNACVAESREPSEFASIFDTVSVCLSKGLGAPIGSVLCGSAEQIERARHFRKLLGGGWRQAGVLAAAGLHALEHHRGSLASDHENAQLLASGLEELGFSVQKPETNMVWCSPPSSLQHPDAFGRMAVALRAEGFLIGGNYGGPLARNPAAEKAKSMRFVTHLQTPAHACKGLLAAAGRFLRALPR